jgi:hypothetical protein
MASTKDAVTDFLQLGAKYELILAGLYDDLTRLQGTVDDVEKRNRISAESVRQAASAMGEMRTAVVHVQDGLEQMRRKMRRQQNINLFLAALSVAAVVLAVVA